MNPRATRSAAAVASVPEETNRIRFIDGTKARTFSARSDSRGLGAPKLVPCAAASAIARTISGCACPARSGPQLST